MATHLKSAGISPEFVVCSPAVRAKETLDGLGDAVASGRVEFDRNLYEASESDLLAAVRRVPVAVESVLLVGHNPSIQHLALLLCVDSEALGDVRRKYPTGALATLSVGAEWKHLRMGGAELVAFVKPRELPSSVSEGL